MLGVFIVLVLLLIVLCFLYWHKNLNYWEKSLKTIPGPKPWPIIGNALDFTSPMDTLPNLMKHYKKYKTNFKLYLGPKPCLFVTEPKDMEFFLNSLSTMAKADFYQFSHNWLGDGLLLSRGERWRKHRKIITPAFHFKILEGFIDIFNSQSDTLISKLEEGMKGVDVYPLLLRCALDVISETSLGTKINAQLDYDSEYAKSINILEMVALARFFSPILANPYLYPLTPFRQKEKRALHVVHSFARSVIDKRKKEFFNSVKPSEEMVDSFGRKRKLAFLDLLLEYQTRNPEFSDDDIRQEVDTFSFAGHDTLGSSVPFILYSLASYPDIQNKVYEEIQVLFADNPERNATYADLQEMKYLEQVIKETLRIYTIAAIIGREVEEDVEWNGVTLPKGFTIILFLYGLHHSENTHEDPEKFDPDRHSLENAKKKHPFSTIPFSGGHRNCIGQRFAMLEMKLIVSKILRHFEVCHTVPQHNMVLKSDGVLKSDTGVHLRFKKRYL